MSKRYTKKPVTIDALELTSGNVVEALEFTEGKAYREHVEGLGEVLCIPTLEGVMQANPGDFIIKGIKGEFYPCKPDVFAGSYDAA